MTEGTGNLAGARPAPHRPAARGNGYQLGGLDKHTPCSQSRGLATGRKSGEQT